MEPGALQERRQAVRDGRVIIREEEGGSVGGHIQESDAPSAPAVPLRVNEQVRKKDLALTDQALRLTRKDPLKT